MRTANQLTFTTYEASLKLSPNNPVKAIFDNINWFFIHPLVEDRCSSQGADGYEPISLLKAQLLISSGFIKRQNNKMRGWASSLMHSHNTTFFQTQNWRQCNQIEDMG